MSEELRSMYDRMKFLQTQETKLRKDLQELTRGKNEIKERIQTFMLNQNIDRLEVRGTPDSLEIVEEKKLETLNKETIIRKIMQFFERAGSTQNYRDLSPELQARAIVHAIYTEREHQIVKKMKMKTDKNVQKVQSLLENTTTTTSMSMPQTPMTMPPTPTAAAVQVSNDFQLPVRKFRKRV